MEKIEIVSFVEGPIFREAAFREKIAAHDWAQYRGKRVLIQGCSSMPLPSWAYLVVTAQLVLVADKVMYGEQKSRIPIWSRTEAIPTLDAEPQG